MKVKEYRKKPVVIEAVQWTGENMGDILGFFGGAALREGQDIIISTLEGEMRAMPDDWIIKGVKGEFYPCKPDIFAATYDDASCQSVSLRITGPNSDGEYWLHLKGGNGPESAGINLGGEHRGMIVSALLKAAAGGAA